MGKKDNEEKQNHKRSKQKSQSDESPKNSKVKPTHEKIETSLEEVPIESEMELNETDCVEVEIANETSQGEDDNLISMSSTPVESPKQSTSKAVLSNSKASTPKPNTGVVSPVASSSNATANAKKSNRKRRDSSTSSEEERWLTAIESGKLEDVDDELKKMKDPKLMTARQRAVYERSINKDPDSPCIELHMSLPTGYREKPKTAEDVQKRALKIQKRKQMADEKREKDKKKTMDRLLNKQESSKQRAAARNKAVAAATKATVPMISYRNTPNGAYILIPPECEFPLKAQPAIDPPKNQLCGIAGCKNLKVYNCSKTNIPLCSLNCYKKNVQAIKQIMC